MERSLISVLFVKCFLALVGKWWWIFRIEIGLLWVRVIKSINGINGSLVDNRVLRKLSGSGV